MELLKMDLNLSKPLAFFDLETTGTDISKDRIVQMFFIKLFPDGREEERPYLINPGIPIPPDSSKVHGIYDNDVKDCKTFEMVAGELFEWLASCDLAGYNSDRFDIPLLSEEFKRAGISFPEEGTKTVDVFKIEKKVNSRTLSETYKRYTGRALDGAHDASADTRATKEILIHQLNSHVELPRDVAELSDIFNEGIVDLAGKLIKINGVICFNFGKHKGLPVSEHQDYVDWMLDHDFPSDTKEKLKMHR